MNFIADDGMFITPMTIEEQLEMGLINADEFFKLIVEKIRSGFKTESIISLINLMPEIMTYRDFNGYNLLCYSMLLKNEELEKYLLENTEK